MDILGGKMKMKDYKIFENFNYSAMDEHIDMSVGGEWSGNNLQELINNPYYFPIHRNHQVLIWINGEYDLMIDEYSFECFFTIDENYKIKLDEKEYSYFLTKHNISKDDFEDYITSLLTIKKLSGGYQK
jgi:hypothetical protein